VSATSGFTPLPDLPELARVMLPTMTISDRVVRAVVTDVERQDVTLLFQPYQAVRLTTVDCFLAPGDLPRRLAQMYWSRSSPWLDELTAALAEVDHTADFMDSAVHFLVPAGDDVLEVVAWQVRIERPGADPSAWPVAPEAPLGST